LIRRVIRILCENDKKANKRIPFKSCITAVYVQTITYTYFGLRPHQRSHPRSLELVCAWRIIYTTCYFKHVHVSYLEPVQVDTQKDLLVSCLNLRIPYIRTHTLLFRYVVGKLGETSLPGSRRHFDTDSDVTSMSTTRGRYNFAFEYMFLRFRLRIKKSFKN
jgi:hypothetical protein